MQSVEKEGMKLYEKVGAIGGGESQRLAEAMEDFGTDGAYGYVHSLNTLPLGHSDINLEGLLAHMGPIYVPVQALNTLTLGH